MYVSPKLDSYIFLIYILVNFLLFPDVCIYYEKINCFLFLLFYLKISIDHLVLQGCFISVYTFVIKINLRFVYTQQCSFTKIAHMILNQCQKFILSFNFNKCSLFFFQCNLSLTWYLFTVNFQTILLPLIKSFTASLFILLHICLLSALTCLLHIYTFWNQ